MSEKRVEEFQEILNSPLGNFLMNKLQSYENKVLYNMFDQIKINLKNNIYTSSKAFFGDVKHTCEYMARIFGIDSEIGLGFLTINQLVEEKMQKSFQKISIEDYKKKFIPIIAELELNLEKLPSSFDEFEKILLKMDRGLHPIHPTTSKDENPLSEFNLKRLQQAILKIPNDERLGDIIEILITYEIDPFTDKTEKSFKLKLNDCQPQTLMLLWNYLLANELVP